MQHDAYNTVEISMLQANKGNARIYEQIYAYAEQYKRVRGHYPDRITVSKKDFVRLSKVAPKKTNLRHKGIPVVAHVE